MSTLALSVSTGVSELLAVIVSFCRQYKGRLKGRKIIGQQMIISDQNDANCHPPHLLYRKAFASISMRIAPEGVAINQKFFIVTGVTKTNDIGVCGLIGL